MRCNARRRFFGAARNIEEGGSLTIIATAMSIPAAAWTKLIFEEFKGTGNSEIVLDRKLSDKRVFPSIDITKSGTRKEELLVNPGTLSKMWILRRILDPMGVQDGMEFLLEKLRESKNNNDFFDHAINKRKRERLKIKGRLITGPFLFQTTRIVEPVVARDSRSLWA